jgi:hypothetical protein
VQASLSAKIRAHIDRLASAASGSTIAQAARRFNALPLYEGWDGWVVLTDSGEVLEEGSEEGMVVPVVEPMHTMCLVIGAESYPELKAMLPLRPESSTECEHCNGTGWFHHGGVKTRTRCGMCRALGWVAVPSNTSLERTREG